MLSVYSVLDNLPSFLIYCSRYCTEGVGFESSFSFWHKIHPAGGCDGENEGREEERPQ